MNEFEKDKTHTIAFRITTLALALIVCVVAAWSYRQICYAQPLLNFQLIASLRCRRTRSAMQRSAAAKIGLYPWRPVGYCRVCPRWFALD